MELPSVQCSHDKCIALSVVDTHSFAFIAKTHSFIHNVNIQTPTKLAALSFSAQIVCDAFQISALLCHILQSSAFCLVLSKPVRNLSFFCTNFASFECGFCNSSARNSGGINIVGWAVSSTSQWW